MTLNFHQLALIALLGTAMHWLVARSEIMSWFWALEWWPRVQVASSEDEEATHTLFRYRAPGLLAVVSKLLACAACAGWWIGLVLGSLGVQPVDWGPRLAWLNVVGGSTLAGVVTVPILEGVLLWGLERSRIE